MNHRPIVFVDVETTGFSARDGRVIELGMVKVENGKVVDTFSELIDPGQEVSWQTTRVTGITTSDVFGKPQFRYVIDRVEDFLGSALFAAHNVDFDYSFLSEEFLRSGSKLTLDRFCTARLSRQLYPEHRSHSLDSLINRHGYNVTSRHRALDDAEVIANFFIDHLTDTPEKTILAIGKITKLSKKPTPKHITYSPLL